MLANGARYSPIRWKFGASVNEHGAEHVGISGFLGMRVWLGQPPQKDSDWETGGVNKRNYFLATSARVHFDRLKIAQASSLLSLPRHENDAALIPPVALVHALRHQSPWHNDIFTRLTF
jgi:hypothetical protein